MPNTIKCTIWTINIKHRDLGKGMLFFLLKEISQKEAVLPLHLEIETRFLFSVSHRNYPISIDFWRAGSSTWTAFKISQQLGPLQYWTSNNSASSCIPKAVWDGSTSYVCARECCCCFAHISEFCWSTQGTSFLSLNVYIGKKLLMDRRKNYAYHMA